MIVRPATPSDVPAILDIYNVSVRESTSAWSEREQTPDERTAWFARQQAAGYGTFVAELADEVVGFAAYGDFRDTSRWEGYRFTVENTVHVLDHAHDRGVGRALMEALIDHATSAGKKVMVAAVDGENAGSVAFHEALGFEVVGRMPGVGWKFGRWLDLVLLQRRLGEG